jgi:hypothetical protein
MVISAFSVSNGGDVGSVLKACAQATDGNVFRWMWLAPKTSSKE